MQRLGAAVAVFALLALGAGLHLGGADLFLLAAGAGLCAYTTWRSAAISSFLKIFVAIFSTETIVFGLARLLEVEGLWPAALADYAPPDSFALTVAVFSILVFARLAYSGRARDDAHRRSLFRQPTTAPSAALAHSGLSRARARHRRRDDRRCWC